MRALVAAALALVAAGAFTGGCGGSSPAAPPTEPPDGIARVPDAPVIGAAEPNAWRRSPAPLTPAQLAAELAALGVESQRFVVDWNIVEPAAPAPGHAYDFEQFDVMYRADRALGIRPLLVVLNAPAWASDPGTSAGSFGNNPPAEERLGDWADFVGEVTRRYPRAIGIEVWNEPNLAGFWGDGSVTVRPDPERYARVLESAYDAVKEVNPHMPVIGGSLSSTQPASPEGDLPASEYLARALEAGAAASMDGLSLHPYPGTEGAARTLELIDELRAVRDEFGVATPLWLTEVGITTTGPGAVGEPAQARELVEICRATASMADVDAVYFHNLVEQPSPGAAFETGFGLLQPQPGGTLRRKPAFEALRRELAAADGCAS